MRPTRAAERSRPAETGRRVARAGTRLRELISVVSAPVTGAARTAMHWLLRRPGLFVCAVYVLLAAWVNARHWLRPYTRISDLQPVENLQSYWFLQHGALSVRHLENPLFSSRVNAPGGVNMMANASELGLSIPMAPLTLLFGPQLSYVVLLTVALAGSAATAYYVLSRYVVRSKVAAVIAGAFWGFAPGIVHHANGQPFLVATFLLPLIALLVFRLGEPRHRLRRGLLLGALVTWQAFISEELLLVTVLGCVVSIGVWALMRRGEMRGRLRPFAAGALVAIAVSGALLAYPLWYQFRGPGSYGPVLGTPATGENIASFFQYARDSLAGTPNQRLVVAGEQNSWYSLPLVLFVLALTVVMWRRALAARIAVIVAAVFTLLSLGPELRIGGRATGVPGPWRLLDGLPLLGLAQPSRLTYVVTAGITVLLALAAETIPRLAVPTQPVRLPTIWYVALAVVFAPVLPMPLRAEPTANVAPFIADGTWREYVDDDHTLTQLPLGGPVADRRSLLWQVTADQGYRQPGGPFLRPDGTGHVTVGTVGPTRDLFDAIDGGVRAPQITDLLRNGVIADLRAWRTAIIVVDPTQRHRSELSQAITEITGVQRLLIGELWVWDVRPLVDTAGR